MIYNSFTTLVYKIYDYAWSENNTTTNIKLLSVYEDKLKCFIALLFSLKQITRLDDH